MSGPTDTAAWIKKAERDLAASRTLGAAIDPSWDIVVFHAQQSAEKYLKALLVSRGIQPPKTHDLTKLLALCAERAIDLVAFTDDCAFLSPLAVLSRYPGDEPETAREDAERCIRIAEGIRTAVLTHIEADRQ